MSRSQKCAICSRVVEPRSRVDDPRASNPAFPFCSDRCRNVDLGRWLHEDYVVSTPQDSFEGSNRPDDEPD